jgi:hypothetical protein
VFSHVALVACNKVISDFTKLMFSRPDGSFPHFLNFQALPL